MTYPLYNTTYTLHRLSPLYSFPPLSEKTPVIPGTRQDSKLHTRSLLSLLRGDVLRGVRVADEEDALGRAGRLKAVNWNPLYSPSHSDEQPEDPRGVVIEFIYEKATYTSHLLVPPSGKDEDEEGFTSLPLLLTRLPKGLRETLTGYLATTFDTLVLPLPLDSETLKGLLETWLDSTLDEEGGGKDIQLVFSAPPPGVSLKAITITVQRSDIAGFYNRGKRLLGDKEGGAFFEGLRHYAQGNMGLDIAALKVMKVACGGFVLGVGTGGGPGKAKIFIPRGEDEAGAADEFVGGLVEASLEAAGR